MNWAYLRTRSCREAPLWNSDLTSPTSFVWAQIWFLKLELKFPSQGYHAVPWVCFGRRLLWWGTHHLTATSIEFVFRCLSSSLVIAFGKIGLVLVELRHFHFYFLKVFLSAHRSLDDRFHEISTSFSKRRKTESNLGVAVSSARYLDWRVSHHQTPNSFGWSLWRLPSLPVGKTVDPPRRRLTCKRCVLRNENYRPQHEPSTG